MESGKNGFDRTGSFALVTYIPDPLGKFLDELRLKLVPGCDPHAHVTLMPPRFLPSTEELAWQHILKHTSHVSAFDLEAKEIEVFPTTNVVYIELGEGREKLMELHQILNSGALAFEEPFPYHPHITLAQGIPVESVPAIAEAARKLWAEAPVSRRFPVERLTFVRNIGCNQWLDLASVELQRPVAVPR
ncbi:MAG: 2'-5' RNA ligase family protein [Bryobacteraceae bacterium]|nr:2'-5' RNA ligase family protein [Bryobacteraceae bacterium]MDW8379285.1 2'-5' RNA ligase family protein [Bryobacterales bacterium]